MSNTTNSVLGEVSGQNNNLHNSEIQNDFNESQTSPTIHTSNRIITGSAPLVVFISPAECGKSMILMSLVQYLRRYHTRFKIEPNKRYINTPEYKDKCQKFNDNLTQGAVLPPEDEKPALSGTVNEILVDILDNNGVKLRLLEAPGEHFFSISNPKKPLEPYLNTIFSRERANNYPIYYVMLLDLHTRDNQLENDSKLRADYEERLKEIYDKGYNSSRGDRLILLYNRFDERDPHPNEEEVLRDFLQTYYNKIRGHFTEQYFLFTRQMYSLLPYIAGVEFVEHRDLNGDIRKTYKTDNSVFRSAAALWSKINGRSWM